MEKTFLVFSLFLLIFPVCVKAQSPRSSTVNSGVLRVHPTNPRYFTDDSGQAIFLTGSHTWNNFQDWDDKNSSSTFDYAEYLDFLESNNHNFFRLWVWEQYRDMPHRATGADFFAPMPYERIGNSIYDSFDLDQFNQAYFDRLRQRVIDAGERGMYVSVMLFEGWGVDTKGYGLGNPWDYHPFNSRNNINGVDGDNNNDSEGSEIHTVNVSPAVLNRQQAYVRKVVDMVNDLDNVLYEISNESSGCVSGAYAWQKSMIDYIHDYEDSKLNQHPVGMTKLWPCDNDNQLFNSNAEWISPSSSYVSDGSKVIISDTDHLCGICGERSWVWQALTNGESFVFMDDYLMDSWGTGSQSEVTKNEIRKNMGYALEYSRRIDLADTIPRPDLSSSEYLLANIGKEYLAYQPYGSSIDISLEAGEYAYEWFDPSNGVVSDTGRMTVDGGFETFNIPFSGEAVLYLKKLEPTPNLTPTNSPPPTTTPAPNQPIPGDTNDDGKVDILDYSILITEFGSEGDELRADFNEDGKVDILDYSVLVAHFGS